MTGFVASIALILPGISVSYLLYLLGVYDQILLAISSLSFSLLIPLGGGVIAGILATTKLLEKAMNRYPQATYLIILGFVLGSMGGCSPASRQTCSPSYPPPFPWLPASPSSTPFQSKSFPKYFIKKLNARVIGVCIQLFSMLLHDG